MKEKDTGKIEVKSNGIVIGHTYDEGKTIDFLDNDEAKKVLYKMNNRTPIGISHRRMGNVDKDGKVTDMGNVNEISIVGSDN